MLAALVLGAAATLPPVIADPRGGPSTWQVVAAQGAVPTPGAEGYLLELGPASRQASQTWLERAVELASRGVPVVSLGATPPPGPLRAYVDGAAVEGVSVKQLAGLRLGLGGLAVVAPAAFETAELVALAEDAGTSMLTGSSTG